MFYFLHTWHVSGSNKKYNKHQLGLHFSRTGQGTTGLEGSTLMLCPDPEFSYVGESLQTDGSSTGGTGQLANWTRTQH